MVHLFCLFLSSLSPLSSPFLFLGYVTLFFTFRFLLSKIDSLFLVCLVPFLLFISFLFCYSFFLCLCRYVSGFSLYYTFLFFFSTLSSCLFPAFLPILFIPFSLLFSFFSRWRFRFLLFPHFTLFQYLPPYFSHPFSLTFSLVFPAFTIFLTVFFSSSFLDPPNDFFCFFQRFVPNFSTLLDQPFLLFQSFLYCSISFLFIHSFLPDFSIPFSLLCYFFCQIFPPFLS